MRMASTGGKVVLVVLDKLGDSGVNVGKRVRLVVPSRSDDDGW